MGQLCGAAAVALQQAAVKAAVSRQQRALLQLLHHRVQQHGGKAGCGGCSCWLASNVRAGDRERGYVLPLVHAGCGTAWQPRQQGFGDAAYLWLA